MEYFLFAIARKYFSSKIQFGNSENQLSFRFQISWGQKFLQKVWDSFETERMRHATFHEQDAMLNLLKKPENQKHAVHVPSTWFNSYASSVMMFNPQPPNSPR
jgi:hypothetical protein